MDFAFELIAIFCGIIGIIGSIVPALPGPPIAYVGVVLMAFTTAQPYSWVHLVVYGVLMFAVQLADFYLPVKITETFGGSPYAKRGSLIGVFAGLFLPPPFWGLIIWPFVGAVIGEKFWDKSASFGQVLKVGLGSFLAFIVGTGGKLIYSCWVLVSVCRHIIAQIFN